MHGLRASVLLCAGIAWLAGPPALGQEPFTVDDDAVVINFPDQIDLTVLVDYVGKALDLHFVFGEELKGQRVELRPSPLQLRKSELMDLLTSLLRVRELAVVQEAPRIHRIVRADQATRSVSTIRSAGHPSDPGSSRMVTQVLDVSKADVKTLAERIERFLSLPKGSLVPLPESGQIIVTDYESRISVLRELIGYLEGPGGTIEVATVDLAGDHAAGLAAQASTILAEGHRLRQRTGAPPSVRSDILPGRLVIVGSSQQVAEAQALLERLRPGDRVLETRPYSARHLGVDRIRSLIEHVLLAPGSMIPVPAGMHADAPSGRLYVSAEAATHAAIERLLEDEDVPLPLAQRPMRMYRPKYRKAADVLTTVSQLLAEGTSIMSGPPTPQMSSGSGTGASAKDRSPASGQTLPPPPSRFATDEPQSAESGRLLRVEGRDFLLTADEHTNAILAVGTRDFHAHLAELIADLDQKRPQVLIEMTLVAITLSDSLDLGVELEALDLGDGWDYLLFSNFGLSTIDVATGQRVLTPGLGANGVLLRPDRVPVVFQALATRANARAISTPKLLVSDNAQGTLRNVDEAPFTSVNAFDTVATTSFAGFESAGTTLTITPHLSEGDHVTLEYNLTFSNFTGTSGAAAVPPPRTTNSFTGTVDVPDGYTLITGGLTVESKTQSISEIPYLGRIPVLGKLFQSSSRGNTATKIFAFIRPTILREDEFEQLKFITLRDAEEAGVEVLKGQPGEPLWMR